MPFANEHACRLRDPGDFKPDSFRRVSREHEGKRYDVIMGKLKDGDDAMLEQTYRYPKDIWEEGEARRHCKSHHGISFEPATNEEAAQNMNCKTFHADIKKKSELDGHLIIEGWASTKDLDRANEVIEPEAFEDALKRRPPKLLIDHQARVENMAGKILSMTLKPIEGFWIKAMLSNATDVADAVTKIKEGILDAFSVGFMPMGEPDIVDGVRHYKAIELYEVSLVAIPCNRECLFSVAKAINWGSDLVVPYNALVKEVEELKLKIIGAPAPVPETVDNQPDGKAAPVIIPAPIPEERYKRFLAELERITQNRHKDAIASFTAAMDAIAKGQI